MSDPFKNFIVGPLIRSRTRTRAEKDKSRKQRMKLGSQNLQWEPPYTGGSKPRKIQKKRLKKVIPGLPARSVKKVPRKSQRTRKRVKNMSKSVFGDLFNTFRHSERGGPGRPMAVPIASQNEQKSPNWETPPFEPRLVYCPEWHPSARFTARTPMVHRKGAIDGARTLRAQRLKNFKILRFSSEIENFKRATHQTPIFCGVF